MKVNRSALRMFSAICLSATLLIVFGLSSSNAQSNTSASVLVSPEIPGTFSSYLDKKYSLYLGQGRSACAHRIDPTEVYQYGNNRFVASHLRQGVGTGCRDVVNFGVFQADCQARKFYEIRTERIPQNAGSSGPIRSILSRFQMGDLREDEPMDSDVHKTHTDAELSDIVCALPVKATFAE